MINKSLLETVLNVTIISDITIVVDDNNPTKPTLVLFYVKDNTDQRGKSLVYNLYELTHKCKEWVWINEYRISSSLLFNKWEIRVSKYSSDLIENVQYITTDTEPEAIFKACEWILENKEQ